jgi:Spy/CpxP family protein refolding chaperone
MNKAQLVELFRVYEKGLAAKARNKSAENAFVSGLYSWASKVRLNTSNNIRSTGKKTAENFKRDFTNLVKTLQDPTANAATLARANKQARQAAVNYYYSLGNAVEAANNATTKLKAARPVNIDVLFKSLVAKAAEVKPARNRLGRPLGSRRYPPGYMQNFALPNGLTMKNFQNKLNKMNTKWTSEKDVKRMVEATLLRKYGSKNASFYARHPDLATGPFRNILNRATNTQKRLQIGASRPSLTASNAQFQALKALSPNGKTYYGNMNIWKSLTPAQINRFTNLTPIQKDALKRMIRSVRLNNMEPNKSKVRAGRNREELTNNLMRINLPNKNLLNVLKKRVAKAKAPIQFSETAAPKNKNQAPSPVGVPSYQDHLRNFGNY